MNRYCTWHESNPGNTIPDGAEDVHPASFVVSRAYLHQYIDVPKGIHRIPGPLPSDGRSDAAVHFRKYLITRRLQ